MRQFFNPFSLIKGLISPPKAQTIQRPQLPVSTPAQDAAAEKKAADEARRKALAEAAKKKGTSQARSVLGGTAVVGEGDVSKPSLLG